ncbi:MAG: helix-turn-helix transcriptional regulator [Chthoniobacteraceae bacterium]
MNMLTARYQDWMSLKTNLVWIYEGAIPANVAEPYNPKSRSRELPYILGGGGFLFPEYCVAWLLLKGSVTVSYEGQILKATAGSWVIPRPGIRQQAFSADAEILSLRFQAQWPDGRALFEEGLSIAFPKARFPRLEENARELLAIAKPYLPSPDATLLATMELPVDVFYEIKIGMLRFVQSFTETLMECGLKPTRLGSHDERVLLALQRLDFLPLSHKLRESDLANAVGLGISQFARLFQAEIGMSPKKYIETRRREVCKRMLINSAVPLKQIAMELGFAHPSDFSYWFRKNYKMSPKAFRYKYPQGSNI